MGKIINFIKKYKYQILLIIIYLLFFIQMQNVRMYADDYFVRSAFRHDNSLIRQIYWIYYKGFSGRLIGQFVVHSGLGYFGIQFFKSLNPIFLFMFCYWSSKIINIKNKHNTLQITMFLSLIMLGLDRHIVSECLYWADGTILYLWGYFPLLLFLYFILDCCINNKRLSNIRFILSIIFIIIISFTMESTAVLGITFLFMVFLNNFITKNNKNNNKKLLFLCIFFITVLIGVYLIPGNQNRMLDLEEPFGSLGIIGRFIIKIPDYFSDLFNGPIFIFLFMMSSIFIYRILKNRYNVLCKICGIFLIISNICLFINYRIYNFIDFYNTNNLTIVLKVFCLLYLLVNIYMCVIVSKKIQMYYLYIIIGGMLANLLSVFFIDYNTMRFQLPLVITFLIYIFECYYDGNDNLKIYILLLYNLILEWKLGIIFLLIYFFRTKESENKLTYLKYILITVMIISNSLNFFRCIYYYYENAKIFDYNEKILSEIDSSSINEIHLKRLTYSDYAFQMPEEHDYIKPWYNDYYDIGDIAIIWDD